MEQDSRQASVVILIPIILTFSLLLTFSFLLLSKKLPTKSEKPAKNLQNYANFANDVKACNSVETSHRFSCYRAVIETYYKGNISGFITRLKDEKDLSFEATFGESGEVSYAIFGTNCHTFYHATGDFIATYSNEGVQKILDYGPTTCTNGYTMGVYKRLALKNGFPTDLLKKFYEVCKEGAENQCAHEIGHILHDKYSYSVLKTLDTISLTQYKLAYPQKYTYALYESSDPKANVDKAFEECRQIMPDKNKLAQCYTGIGHNLFLFGEFANDGYKSVFSECSERSGTNKNDCYAFLIYRIGINEAGTKFLSHKFEEGKKICSDVTDLARNEQMKEHCYRGIGGGIGLFVDSEYALTNIDEKNLVSIKRQLLEYMKLCEQSEEAYINSCFAGLFGTKFAKFYDLLKIYYEQIDKLRPSWDSDFEVVG